MSVRDGTYTNGDAILVRSRRKFYYELGASFFFGIVQRTETTYNFNTVFSSNFPLSSHRKTGEWLDRVGKSNYTV